MRAQDQVRPTEGAAPASTSHVRLRTLRRAAGALCALSGAQMLVVWPILIGSGQVPELHTQTIYMLFHLLSEAATALLCVAVGLGLLLGARWAPRLYFICGSMSVTAVTLAIAFYAFAPAPNKTATLVALLTSWALTLGTLVAVYRLSGPASPERERTVPALLGGALFYVLLNAAGFAAERRDGYSITYACALLTLACFSLAHGWRTARSSLNADARRTPLGAEPSSAEARSC